MLLKGAVPTYSGKQFWICSLLLSTLRIGVPGITEHTCVTTKRFARKHWITRFWMSLRTNCLMRNFSPSYISATPILLLKRIKKPETSFLHWNDSVMMCKKESTTLFV